MLALIQRALGRLVLKAHGEEKPAPEAKEEEAPQKSLADGAPRHRLVTVHSSDASSPGHTVRVAPHPERQGVWNVHEDDREKVRRLLSGEADETDQEEGDGSDKRKKLVLRGKQTAKKLALKGRQENAKSEEK